MTTLERDTYLGLETDPREASKFKTRLLISLMVISAAIGLMLIQENFTPKRVSARGRARRELNITSL